MTITYLNIRRLASLHKNLAGMMGQAAVACKWKDTKFYEIHQLICMLLRNCISIRNMAIQDCCHYYEILNMYSVASYLVSYINLILECSALGLHTSQLSRFRRDSHVFTSNLTLSRPKHKFSRLR